MKIMLTLFSLLLSITTIYFYVIETVDASPPTMTLSIPAIGLKSEVIPINYTTITANDGKQYLEWNVDDNLIGWHKVTAPLGEVGNTILNGHSDAGGMVFQHLNKVQVGNVMTATVYTQSYVYTVTDRVIVTEAGATIEQRVANAKWILPTNDNRLTLITCISGTNRLIVVAKR